MIALTLPTPNRLGALRRFAVTTTLLTLCGHMALGYEMSYAVPIVAILVAYGVQLLLEAVRCSCTGERPGYAGGGMKLVEFLLPAHIIGLTCSVFIYPGERIAPVVFATVLAVS